MGLRQKIQVYQGHITKIAVYAIVNAANTYLMGGGGVYGATHHAGGPAILGECRKIVARQGGCKVSEAVISTGGNLPAKYVTHTVGPVWNGGNNNEGRLLANCYANSLRLAAETGIHAIALPNISTGIYRFPKQQATVIAVNTVKDFLNPNSLPGRVIFVCFDEENIGLWLYRHLIE